MICELIGGYTPFQDPDSGNNPRLILEKIRMGQINLPKNLDNITKDLINNILVLDANIRFDIDDIKKHKFFKGINWNSVASKTETPFYIPEISEV